MLPEDTKGKAGGGGFYTLEQGANKFLVVGEAITGYEYWTTDDKPVVSPEVFESTPDIRLEKKKVKEAGVEVEKMVETRQKYFWALPIYDFKDKAIKIFQIRQKGIREELAALQANEDWGNPVGNYSITITKSGEKFETKYSVTANPDKDPVKKEIEEAMQAEKDNPTDVEGAIFRSED